MFNLGPMEMLVIVIVALVVLGPKRLPDAMRQVGKGVGELRRWTTQLNTEVHSAFEPGGDTAPAGSFSTQAATVPGSQPPAEVIQTELTAPAESGAA